MELEKQVCSLELAKRLKELGVKQNTLASWAKDFDFPNVEKGWRLWIDGEICGPGYDASCFDASHERKHHPEIEIYSAFNVAELGELLPDGIPTKCHHFYNWSVRRQSWGERLWEIGYRASCNGGCLRIETADTEADARAKMLIYLLENKLLEVGK